MKILYLDCTGGVTKGALEGCLTQLGEGVRGARVIASAVNLGAPIDPVAAEKLLGRPVLVGAAGRTDAAGAEALGAMAPEFGDMPVLTLTASARCAADGGCVTALLGESSAAPIVELTASIDDMTPEALGFALERFFAAGALEAYTSPLNMKKSRPGVLLTVMCPEPLKEKMLGEIFRHTTTIGVRAGYSQRFALRREVCTIATPYGDMRRKVSRGFGVTRAKWEYEDMARAARETGRSLDEIRVGLDAYLRESGDER